jgi:hypothetical protein
MKELSKTIRKSIAVLLCSTSLFAGGDNKVSMTDMKEALYNLVISADKSEVKMTSMDERISRLEPIAPSVERNSKSLSSIINRLNELGVPTSYEQNQDISDEISRFVKQNPQYLPQGTQGVH